VSGNLAIGRQRSALRKKGATAHQHHAFGKAR